MSWPGEPEARARPTGTRRHTDSRGHLAGGLCDGCGAGGGCDRGGCGRYSSYRRRGSDDFSGDFRFAAAKLPDDCREGRADPHAGRHAPVCRYLPSRGGRRTLSRDHEHERLPEGQALGSACGPRGGGQSAHELGDGQSAVVGPARVCLRARGLARHREIARQVGAQLVSGKCGFLRRDRVDRQTAMVLRQHRPLGHFLSCELAMAGCQSPASVAQGDHALGGTRRPVPRPGLSRRHFCPGLHRQLVADPYGAPSARPAAQL